MGTSSLMVTISYQLGRIWNHIGDRESVCQGVLNQVNRDETHTLNVGSVMPWPRLVEHIYLSLLLHRG